MFKYVFCKRWFFFLPPLTLKTCFCFCQTLDLLDRNRPPSSPHPFPSYVLPRNKQAGNGQTPNGLICGNRFDLHNLVTSSEVWCTSTLGEITVMNFNGICIAFPSMAFLWRSGLHYSSFEKCDSCCVYHTCELLFLNSFVACGFFNYYYF